MNLLLKPTLLIMMTTILLITANEIVISHHHRPVPDPTTVNPRQSFLDPTIGVTGIFRQDHVVAVRDLTAVTVTATAVR